MELELRGLGHDFGPLTVLDDVSFAVRESEIVSVIGPSGCGKSTLLSIAGGLIAPCRGSAVTVGVPPAASLNPFTFVFQDAGLLPWRTVAGNVGLALEDRLPSRKARAEIIEEVLERTGLREFAQAYPKQLSGGMKQRVGIARALAARPAFLLMDEPLSAVDAQTRELLMEEFLTLWLRDRVSILYVTHNLDEAVRLSDRIVVLSRRPGRVREIVDVGIPQAERSRPDVASELSTMQNDIWNLLRSEARNADRELLSLEQADV
ncbi:ABC transporter ATP-binding protein [Methylocystis iwaonis]|uniref:ABC transporter ATP-binding protein n=1 Tax=Methylocystis iwaonis TaxID=2885079 RepID=UPI002E7C2168|nr:ABC transporter ATP-binding protein [Methylocystis iwaonis]